MRHRSPDPGSEGPAHERALAFVGADGRTRTTGRSGSSRVATGGPIAGLGTRPKIPGLGGCMDSRPQRQLTRLDSRRPRKSAHRRDRVLTRLGRCGHGRHSPQTTARSRGCTDRGVDKRSFTCRLAAAAARRRLTRAWARESRRRVGAGRAQGPRRRSKAPPLQEAERATARGSRAPGCVSCSP